MYDNFFDIINSFLVEESEEELIGQESMISKVCGELEYCNM